MPPKRVSLYVCTVLLFLSPLFAFSSNVQADESAAIEQLSQKLDKVIKNQETLIQKVQEIKEELYIVKIRSTR